MYSREEVDVGSSSDLYIPRALAQEEALQLALRHDLYVPDLCSIALSAAWTIAKKQSTLSAAGAAGGASGSGSGSKRPNTSGTSGSGASSSLSVPSLSYMDTRDWADVAAAIATTQVHLSFPPPLTDRSLFNPIQST